MQILQIFGFVVLILDGGEPFRVDRVHVHQDSSMVYVIDNFAGQCWFTGGKSTGTRSEVTCESVKREEFPQFEPFQVRPDLIMSDLD